MSIDVFVSVGRTSTKEQEDFVSAIERHLQANGLTPQIVGRTAFMAGAPLQGVDDLMRKCNGTVIIAFERIFIEQGLERRGSPAAAALEQCGLTTVWNQIEAAMAYVHRHPLLVIVQEDLRNDGLLEKGYDWWVQRVPIAASSLTAPEFSGVFADWKRRVESFHEETTARSVRPDFHPGDVRIRDLIRGLTIGNVLALVAGLVFVVASIVGIVQAFS